jgi:hypothetical protein
MIVCHCNVISEREIEATVERLLHDDPWRLIVPVQVYHELEKRGRCCGCFPNVVDIIVRVTTAFHERQATPQAEIFSLVERLRQRERETAASGTRVTRAA